MTRENPSDHSTDSAQATLIGTLGSVPRSARWILPAFASAFQGTDASTLEQKVRTLVLLRVAAVDRAPYWRVRHEAGAESGGLTSDEIELVGSDEWENAPAFSDRERAAILWGDRIAKRLARRDSAAYREVRAQFDDTEIVELTAIASIAAMADRITNALRIAPDDAPGLTPAVGAIDDRTLGRWSREMFDTDPATTWPETTYPT